VNHSTVRSIMVALYCLWSGLANAQSTPAPGHQHYQKPASYDQASAPGMPLAPRLQNLGVHTFKVSTSSDRAQLFINQGFYKVLRTLQNPERTR